VTVDELLDDPVTALGLPAGGIPLHAVILVEYANPSSSQLPHRSRIAVSSDDDCPSWMSIGMLRFALQREFDAVGEMEDADDD
jgi:hypothetical protein